MSVLMYMTVKGDTERFRQFVSEEAERLTAIAETAKSQGCIHHRFGIGDGYVVVVDEWESPEQFQRFFDGNEEIAAVMRDAGARSEPQVDFTDAITSADQF
jgi:heme-degrading monooxygenase HmoA